MLAADLAELFCQYCQRAHHKWLTISGLDVVSCTFWQKTSLLTHLSCYQGLGGT
jgi:hypothetical protein